MLVIQSFGKIEALKALVPTQKEPPLLAVQGALLAAFLILGWFSIRRPRPVPA